MDLNPYFNPVSLERSEYPLINEKNSFSRSIRINTPDTPISRPEEFDVAIMGVQEERNAYIPGSANATDIIRQKLYELAAVNRKTRIIDLGNLKIAEKVNDTYFALRDILLELIEKNVVLIVMGGSQDLAKGLALAFENRKGFHSFTTIDSRLDFGFGKEALNSRNYLDDILKQKNSSKLSIYNMGHQVYFTPVGLYDKFENAGHHSLRIGSIRENVGITEPYLRDSELVLADLSSVKQSDAPAASGPSPNGFYGHEFCQLSRYAGASNKMKAILFSELIPEKDINGMTSHLVAQAIWYFVDGLAIRKPENPQEKGSKKFIVSTSAADQNLVFYKSNLTDRWWMEIPVINPDTSKNYLMPCSYEDYQRACTNDIPDRWWRFMKRFS